MQNLTNQKVKPKIVPFQLQPEFHYKGALSNVWPHKENNGDRIIDQLTLAPISSNISSRIILAYNVKLRPEELGMQKFIKDDCPVKSCELIDQRYESKIDAVVFKRTPSRKMLHQWSRNKNIVKIWYELESPYHSPPTHMLDYNINWTATYRRDSTIVTPYEKFVPFDTVQAANVTQVNHAAKKTEMVAWFVSNCRDKNGRLNYAIALGKHVQVDIYGSCGNKTCPRKEANRCFEMLNKRYKFYLSFENSACKDYITEKLFWNALQNEVVPIVMGAHPADYAAIAPPHSFIHVDDFKSPKDLANYLMKLDADDQLYNEYFRWKNTGSFINTKFWCRVCSMLHEQASHGVHTWYNSAHTWATRTLAGPACLPKPNGRDGFIWSSWRLAPFNYTSSSGMRR
ncbi:hypothetical protein CAPTEDRAFT_132452 [Capitella teleta]|uniref:Fucosyltransferase n=1 Tax=Capitella teleta TaxID=283909 RepID=R7V7E5_CAPTE|nr:hypothetical protein CAPTEDRAFT_132452 [Capitella teleta]|eukprot:ELU14773.1 hypothetical protein CAPTEDRAFT_132452 [Capitella teleta]